MQLEPFPHLFDGPADATTSVSFRLGTLVISRFTPSSKRQVAAFGSEKFVLEPPINRAYSEALSIFARHFKLVGITIDDCGDRLTFTHGRRKNFVHFLEHVLVYMDSFARIAAQSLICYLRCFRDVVFLLERTVVLIIASVADERKLRKPVAYRLTEVLTRLEASRRHLAQFLRSGPIDHLLAFVEVGAKPVRASVALVAVDAMVLQFLTDRRLRSSEFIGDLFAIAVTSNCESDCMPI